MCSRTSMSDIIGNPATAGRIASSSLVILLLAASTALAQPVRLRVETISTQLVDRPFDVTVTSVNGAVSTLIRSLAIELAPVRVNAIHPGIVGDTPAWKDANEVLEGVRKRTPTGRLVQTSDVVDASMFLLENPSMNGVNLAVDGGWTLM